MKKYNIAIVGASGNVGREILDILGDREFSIGELYLLGSEKSQGSRIIFQGKEHKVDLLDNFDFKGVDIAFFSAGGDVSKKYCEIAEAAGAYVIDNTSYFRMQKDIALVVPQVNPRDIKKYSRKIIANPNCSTIQMVIPLKLLHGDYKIKRVVVSTYQAVSGAGKDAMDELYKQTKGVYEATNTYSPKIFTKEIAFNCIPQIDKFLPNGNTKEEQKMIDETKKIMGDDSIKVSATCVRVPVFNCHSESVNIEFEEDYEMEDILMLLKNSEDVFVVDDISQNSYITPKEVSKTDEVYISRIRRDESVKSGLNMWIVADNLRKGAALNAVDIADQLIEMGLV